MGGVVVINAELQRPGGSGGTELHYRTKDGSVQDHQQTKGDVEWWVSMAGISSIGA